MLRDKNLIPLSHQHQHALALCVRLEGALRSGSAGLAAPQDEIQAAFDSEIGIHFEAEEQFLFPVAERFDQLKLLISKLLAEHIELRSYRFAAMAHSMNRSDLLDFAATLSRHIRTEERELFEACQRLMTAEELDMIGDGMDRFFRAHGLSKEGESRSSSGASG